MLGEEGRAGLVVCGVTDASESLSRRLCTPYQVRPRPAGGARPFMRWGGGNGLAMRVPLTPLVHALPACVCCPTAVPLLRHVCMGDFFVVVAVL